MSEPNKEDEKKVQQELSWNVCICGKEMADLKFVIWNPGNGEPVKFGMSTKCFGELVIDKQKAVVVYKKIIEQGKITDMVCPTCGEDLNARYQSIIVHQWNKLSELIKEGTKVHWEDVGKRVVITKDGQTGGSGKEGMITFGFENDEGKVVTIITKDNRMYQKLMVNCQVVQ